MNFDELFVGEFGDKYLDGFLNGNLRLDAEEVMRLVRSAQEEMRERAANEVADRVDGISGFALANAIRNLPIEV